MLINNALIQTGLVVVVVVLLLLLLLPLLSSLLPPPRWNGDERVDMNGLLGLYLVLIIIIVVMMDGCRLSITSLSRRWVNKPRRLESDSGRRNKINLLYCFVVRQNPHRHLIFFVNEIKWAKMHTFFLRPAQQTGKWSEIARRWQHLWPGRKSTSHENQLFTPNVSLLFVRWSSIVDVSDEDRMYIQ